LQRERAPYLVARTRFTDPPCFFLSPHNVVHPVHPAFIQFIRELDLGGLCWCSHNGVAPEHRHVKVISHLPIPSGRLIKNRLHYPPSFVPSARTGLSSGGSRGRKPTRASISTPARITGYVSAHLFTIIFFQQKRALFAHYRNRSPFFAFQSI
jgi:hypothetical protein